MPAEPSPSSARPAPQPSTWPSSASPCGSRRRWNNPSRTANAEAGTGTDTTPARWLTGSDDGILMIWSFRNRSVTLGRRPLVMGIVNVTPDSFSDGGLHSSIDAAIAHALRLAAEGADFLDVGGESSRPGAKPVSLDEELARVVPVIRGLVKQTDLPISIDTTKSEVVRQALQAGAVVVNDITAARDPGMADVVRQFGAGIVLMHMQGTPETMQTNPNYRDVVSEVRDFLAERVQSLVAVCIPAERLAIDPGIGFGKTSAHNLTLLRELGQLRALGRPVLL